MASFLETAVDIFSAAISLRKAAALDNSRFVGMQCQPELRETLAQFRQKPLCFVTMLASRNEI